MEWVKRLKWLIHKFIGTVQFLVLLGLGMLLCLPVLMVLSGSLADTIEWSQRLEPMAKGTSDYISWKWIPDYPTLEHFRDLLFYAPDFLTLFWNSVKIAGCVLVGQMIVGIPCAWAFAVYRFQGKNLLFSLYVLLMLLPFQATMLAKYLVLNGMGLMDTHGAVILPAVFSTFPVFLIYRGFRGIPPELYEVARIDGAGEWVIFTRVGVPLGSGSILSAFVLSFFEVWNMMEEPLAFLRTMSLWPLSLYLPQISAAQAGRACGASVIMLAVSLFVFGIFRNSLEKGIVSSALKG